jgi:hypothetical protein
MKKELSPPAMIAIIAVFVVVVVAFGWFWINYNPVSSDSAGKAGAGTTMPAAVPNGPKGNTGSEGNKPLTPDV